MAKGLTPKQEAFCVAFIKSGKASSAYRAAGYSKGMAPKTVNEAASRLLKNGNVVARMAELRGKVTKRAVLTLESHLARLEQLGRKSEKKGQMGVAVSAEVYRGKASGFYTPKDEGPELALIGEPGDGEVTLDKARRVAFVLQAGVRIIATMPKGSAPST